MQFYNTGTTFLSNISNNWIKYTIKSGHKYFILPPLKMSNNTVINTPD